MMILKRCINYLKLILKQKKNLNSNVGVYFERIFNITSICIFNTNNYYTEISSCSVNNEHSKYIISGLKILSI